MALFSAARYQSLPSIDTCPAFCSLLSRKKSTCLKWWQYRQRPCLSTSNHISSFHILKILEISKPCGLSPSTLSTKRKNSWTICPGLFVLCSLKHSRIANSTCDVRVFCKWPPKYTSSDQISHQVSGQFVSSAVQKSLHQNPTSFLSLCSKLNIKLDMYALFSQLIENEDDYDHGWLLGFGQYNATKKLVYDKKATKRINPQPGIWMWFLLLLLFASPTPTW